jgi:hypothetical protein
MTAWILDTFMPQARNEVSSPEMCRRLERIGVETMDLTAYADFLHPRKPYMPEEKLIYKIIEELVCNRSPQDEIDQLNQYVQNIVEQAYLAGEIGEAGTYRTASPVEEADRNSNASVMAGRTRRLYSGKLPGSVYRVDRS